MGVVCTFCAYFPFSAVSQKGSKREGLVTRRMSREANANWPTYSSGLFDYEEENDRVTPRAATRLRGRHISHSEAASAGIGNEGVIVHRHRLRDDVTGAATIATAYRPPTGIRIPVELIGRFIGKDGASIHKFQERFQNARISVVEPFIEVTGGDAAAIAICAAPCEEKVRQLREEGENVPSARFGKSKLCPLRPRRLMGQAARGRQHVPLQVGCSHCWISALHIVFLVSSLERRPLSPLLEGPRSRGVARGRGRAARSPGRSEPRASGCVRLARRNVEQPQPHRRRAPRLPRA
jgi:hypothetical protein